MFCTQCGKELGSGQRFCGSCGASAELTNGNNQSQRHASGLEEQGAVPDFGKAKLKFWGRLPPASACILPESYLWLLEDITLTVFDNYLTVTPGSEERSKIADIATSGAMPLVTLVAGAVRVVKDKVVNALDTPSIDVFQKAFVAGDLL